MISIEPIILSENKETPIVVVKISTSKWVDSAKRLNCKRTLSVLKRECLGFDFVTDDITNSGIDILDSFINFEDCVDGLYQVIIVNQHRDWETGCIDEYDYKLIPFSR